MTPMRTATEAPPDAGPAATGARRGRHRKPRPRKLVLATGGLALAAGVLSLIRVTSHPGVGAPGTAQAESRAAAPTDAPVVPAASATALPSATSAPGGASPARTNPRTSRRTPPASASPAATGVAPATTVPPPSSPAARRPAPTAPTAAPAPTPSTPPPAPTAHPTPTPAPTPPRGGGVCVPVIGLCVDALDRG